MLLLLLSLVVVAPPHRSLVLAFQAQMPTCLTLALAFVTLLSSKPASEAAYWSQPSRTSSTTCNACLPDRDLLCILVPLGFGSDDFGAAIAVTLLFCPPLLDNVGIAQR